MIKMYKKIIKESRTEHKNRVWDLRKETADAEWKAYFLQRLGGIENFRHVSVPFIKLFDDEYDNGRDIEKLTIDCIRALYSVGDLQTFRIYSLYGSDPYEYMPIRFRKGYRDPERVADEALHNLTQMLAYRDTDYGYTDFCYDYVDFNRLSYHWKIRQAILKKDIVRYIKSVWNNRTVKEFAPLYKIHEPELYRRCAR